jgi:hypothetical protein
MEIQGISPESLGIIAQLLAKKYRKGCPKCGEVMGWTGCKIRNERWEECVDKRKI